MPRSTDFRSHAWRIHYVGCRRPLAGPKIAHYDPPQGGVALAPCPPAPAANAVFTAAELDERIAAHARRVAADPESAGGARAVCWCCGETCPSGSWVENSGWYSRIVNIAGWCGSELYCHECFARWGWPDAPSTEGCP